MVACRCASLVQRSPSLAPNCSRVSAHTITADELPASPPWSARSCRAAVGAPQPVPMVAPMSYSTAAPQPAPVGFAPPAPVMVAPAGNPVPIAAPQAAHVGYVTAAQPQVRNRAMFASAHLSRHSAWRARAQRSAHTRRPSGPPLTCSRACVCSPDTTLCPLSRCSPLPWQPRLWQPRLRDPNLVRMRRYPCTTAQHVLSQVRHLRRARHLRRHRHRPACGRQRDGSGRVLDGLRLSAPARSSLRARALLRPWVRPALAPEREHAPTHARRVTLARPGVLRGK